MLRRSADQGEDSPFFGRKRRSACKLTTCLATLAICAAVAVVVGSMWIADRQQVSADLVLNVDEDGDFAFWDPNTQLLYWVDRQAQQMNAFSPINKTNQKMQFNHSLGIVVPRSKYADSVVVISGNNVSSFNLTNGEEKILALFRNGSSAHFSDGRCDPSGRLWVSVSPENGKLVGTLYRIDSSKNVIAVMENVSTPGGMAWTKDMKTLYFIDSVNSQVNAYSYDSDSGQIHFLKVAVTVPSEFGTLSGMTIDSEDSLWIALIGLASVNGTGRVCRYDPIRGVLDETIRLPVSTVTSCVFGGSSLDELYITTRRRPGEEQSGGLYVARKIGAKGLPPVLYAG